MIKKALLLEFPCLEQISSVRRARGVCVDVLKLTEDSLTHTVANKEAWFVVTPDEREVIPLDALGGDIVLDSIFRAIDDEDLVNLEQIGKLVCVTDCGGPKIHIAIYQAEDILPGLVRGILNEERTRIRKKLEEAAHNESN